MCLDSGPQGRVGFQATAVNKYVKGPEWVARFGKLLQGVPEGERVLWMMTLRVRNEDMVRHFSAPIRERFEVSPYHRHSI